MSGSTSAGKSTQVFGGEHQRECFPSDGLGRSLSKYWLRPHFWVRASPRQGLRTPAGTLDLCLRALPLKTASRGVPHPLEHHVPSKAQQSLLQHPPSGVALRCWGHVAKRALNRSYTGLASVTVNARCPNSCPTAWLQRLCKETWGKQANTA